MSRPKRIMNVQWFKSADGWRVKLSMAGFNQSYTFVSEEAADMFMRLRPRSFKETEILELVSKVENKFGAAASFQQ